MEDEIERNESMLFKKNGEENKQIYFYMYMPYNGNIENSVITDDFITANNLAKKNNGQIIFFKKETFNEYKFYNK